MIEVTLTLIPSKASLTARVFSNQHIGLKPNLFFDIEIPVKSYVAITCAGLGGKGYYVLLTKVVKAGR